MVKRIVLTAFLSVAGFAFSQDKFAQLYDLLPTPNVYRTASGAPGHQYYQQKADYKIEIILDDENQQIKGLETITYTNNSPDLLSYLWIQLDQNIYDKNSDSKLIRVDDMNDFKSIEQYEHRQINFDGGFKIEEVASVTGQKIRYFINKTMMRIDLEKPLASKQSVSFRIKWWYNINDRDKVGGRSGMEYFKEENNYLYTIAQFFPRMCVYNDVEGWQNKQFLGQGEFTLPFGDYTVSITVPEDHIVAGTGELQNASTVLTAEQRNRFKQAQTSDQPVLIVTEEEARKAEKEKKTKTKTWIFKAVNVRDFAFASSRKFIWDAMNVKIGNQNILAMSYYPKEGNPLWERYSTKLVAHTLKTYSKYTIDYPYPVAISIHSKNIGMEYPMISFNGGRPEPDGTYSAETKYGMWSVIIHEVGHNFFPMIINSDERQWSWMDEGLNTFVQYLTEQEWERNYPSRRGPAPLIVDYMRGDQKNINPVMTNSESVKQFGNNAYGKPATALNILRETIMGRELFDYAFKTYCERWKFKHPSPADFFRTMEDASAVDLDWFWRGWFYTTEFVDISLDKVAHKQLMASDPAEIKKEQKAQSEKRDVYISELRNKTGIPQTINELDSTIDDFYAKKDIYVADKIDYEEYEHYLNSLSENQKQLLNQNIQLYELTFTNAGGLVMPVIVQAIFEDDTYETVYIPAEIWRMNDQTITKVFIFNKKVKQFRLDPYLETADCDLDNNFWPPQKQPTRFESYTKSRTRENLMQKNNRLNSGK